MKIIYKKAAIDDLLNTENYIINQFHNDQAAKKLKNNIVDTISLLKDNPYLGPKMSDRFDIDTPFRYLIVSKQLVFYNVNEENIEIIRILDSSQPQVRGGISEGLGTVFWHGGGGKSLYGGIPCHSSR